MDAFPELAPEGDPFVRLDGRESWDDLPALVDPGPGGDDRAHSAARELELPVDPRSTAAAVIVIEPPGDIGAEDSVLDLEAPKAKRLEDCLGAHRWCPVTSPRPGVAPP